MSETAPLGKSIASRLAIVLAGLMVVVLIGVIDRWAGPELPFDLFYLAPILLVTWFAGVRLGIGLALVTVIVSIAANRLLAGEATAPPFAVWRILMMSGFFLAFIALVAKLRAQAQRLEQLASQDSLTGVENRRAFYRQTQAELQRCRRYHRPFAVAYIDIDNFKIVNDTAGHRAGDDLLREIAASLQEHTRDVDTVGRIGGDEFAVLLPETDAAGARIVLERTKQHLAQLAARHDWPTTFSIGVVAFAEAPGSIDDVIGLSDRVMYGIKRQGKNNMAIETWPAVYPAPADR